MPERAYLNFSDPTHPIWIIARQLVLGALLLGFLALNYNRLDSRDTFTIFGVMAGVLGLDVAKLKIAGTKSGDPSSTPTP